MLIIRDYSALPFVTNGVPYARHYGSQEGQRFALLGAFVSRFALRRAFVSRFVSLYALRRAFVSRFASHSCTGAFWHATVMGTRIIPYVNNGSIREVKSAENWSIREVILPTFIDSYF